MQWINTTKMFRKLNYFLGWLFGEWSHNYQKKWWGHNFYRHFLKKFLFEFFNNLVARRNVVALKQRCSNVCTHQIYLMWRKNGVGFLWLADRPIDWKTDRQANRQMQTDREMDTLFRHLRPDRRTSARSQHQTSQGRLKGNDPLCHRQGHLFQVQRFAIFEEKLPKNIILLYLI